MNGSTTVRFCGYTIGTDAYGAIGEICAPYGTRVLVICDEAGFQAAKEAFLPAVEGAGLSVTEIVPYGSECTKKRMEELGAAARSENADMIFGVGGGKAIDTAKGAADTAGLPVFTFPTIASTCAGTTALSVAYREDGTFEAFRYFDGPPVHCFIHTGIIANAPAKYLRAGMGDTLGKAYECSFAARGDRLGHRAALGLAISRRCGEPLLEYGAEALRDCENRTPSKALEEAVLAIVVTTGLVSLLVPDELNCAIAHSVYYALCVLPGFEEKNLHGDVVGYGVLVQLAVDGDFEELARVRRFLASIGIKCTLREMGVSPDREALRDVLPEVLNGPDMTHIPYPVTEEMVFRAMEAVERYGTDA